MCEWIVFDGKNYPDDDREVLLYIEDDTAVYFGFFEPDKDHGQWWFNLDNDWHTVEDYEIVCYLEFPFISKSVLEQAKKVLDR